MGLPGDVDNVTQKRSGIVLHAGSGGESYARGSILSDTVSSLAAIRLTFQIIPIMSSMFKCIHRFVFTLVQNVQRRTVASHTNPTRLATGKNTVTRMNT